MYRPNELAQAWEVKADYGPNGQRYGIYLLHYGVSKTYCVSRNGRSSLGSFPNKISAMAAIRSGKVS